MTLEMEGLPGMDKVIESNRIKFLGAKARREGKQPISGFAVGSKADSDWKIGFFERKEFTKDELEK